MHFERATSRIHLAAWRWIGAQEGELRNPPRHVRVHLAAVGALTCKQVVFRSALSQNCLKQKIDFAGWSHHIVSKRRYHLIRKITVEDSSVKRSMDLRLLYGVAYGHSWFGRWGYKFYYGSFGVIEPNYEAAIRVLSSLNINNVLQDLGRESRDKLVKEIVQV
ncbi:hypothetical protein GIB67_015849 [Kingdonia uniflora]|uniref:Uncharacterized protein n=1 Tax=Kingdonia uniflora TaxID=39325 RepID=A0A7J7NEB9_9MAGN|nr:hypothetical protein GIB67_015849 [Kingdonia uniflora]